MATTASVARRAGRGTAPQTRNLGLALVVIAIAQLMVVLDTAIVNIALPSIQRALHFTPTGLEWVVNGYALAFGGLLLLGGRAGDLFGRRRVNRSPARPNRSPARPPTCSGGAACLL